MESSCSTSLLLLLLSPLNLLSMASLSVYFFFSALPIHSLSFASSHPLKSASLTSFLLLSFICPCPPSSSPSISSTAPHSLASFFLHFLHLSLSLPKQVFCMPVMSQVCLCVCVCVSEWYCSPSHRVNEMIHLLAASLHPSPHQLHHRPPHLAAHFHSDKGVNLSEMSGVLTNSQLLAICPCVCVCVCVLALQCCCCDMVWKSVCQVY